MPQPHVIRLRGPWLCWPASIDQLSDASPVTIDCRDEDGLRQLLEADLPARLVFGRRFHRPTGLDETTSVQLVVENRCGQMGLTLNSQRLGSVDGGHHEFDVSTSLEPANQLHIELLADETRRGRGLTDLFLCQLEIC